MGSLGEEADTYTPPQTLNIADLDVVSVDIELLDREGNADGKVFKYKAISVNGEEYRVPGPVLGALKEIRKEKPELKHFKVKKVGEGLKSKYTVIPLDN